MKKNFNILAVAIVGLFTATLANAIPISGDVTFKGGVTLTPANASTATQVTSWLNPMVESVDGFAGFINVGDSVAMTAPWTFNSGVHANLWSVGGFTFDLISSSIVYQGIGGVVVTGTGNMSGNSFDTTSGTWSFSTQNPSAAGVFSFSSASAVPDGGTTMALLGFGMVALEGLRRKVSK